MIEQATYNPELARKAQDDLCEQNELPHFTSRRGMVFATTAAATST